MGKFLAIICALSLSCAVLTGCSDDKNTGSDTEKSVSDSTNYSTENGTVSENEEELTLAQIYTNSLENASFRAKMVTSSDFMDDTSTLVEVSGSDYHLSIGDGDMQTEMYLVGGVMYVLNHSDMNYITDDAPAEQYVNIDTSSYTMGVEDSYIFIGSETTNDGLICETYHAPDLLSGELPSGDEDGEVTIYKYYFEEGSKTPKKIAMTAYGMEQTTTFEEFSFDIDPIELPDLSGWTDDTEAVEQGAESENISEDFDDEDIEVEVAQAAEND